MQGSLSNLGSLTILRAILYLLPNFSNSAMTQSDAKRLIRVRLIVLLCTTTCDVWDTLGVQAVHHALDNVHLVFDGEVDEVGVHEDVEGRPQLGVVLEEESAGLLNMLRSFYLVWILWLLFLGRGSVLVF